MTLQQFLVVEYSRTWLRSDDLEVYVRKGPRGIFFPNAQLFLSVPCLTIADIQMKDHSDPKLPFARWFRSIEATVRKNEMSLFFENVGGWPWMEKFLANRHFSRNEDQSLQRDQLDAYRLFSNTLPKRGKYNDY